MSVRYCAAILLSTVPTKIFGRRPWSRASVGICFCFDRKKIHCSFQKWVDCNSYWAAHHLGNVKWRTYIPGDKKFESRSIVKFIWLNTVRSHCGSNDNPTVGQFVDAIRLGLAYKQLRKANCQEDNASLVSDLHNFLLGDKNEQPSSRFPMDNYGYADTNTFASCIHSKGIWRFYSTWGQWRCYRWHMLVDLFNMCLFYKRFIYLYIKHCSIPYKYAIKSDMCCDNYQKVTSTIDLQLKLQYDHLHIIFLMYFICVVYEIIHGLHFIGEFTILRVR